MKTIIQISVLLFLIGSSVISVQAQIISEEIVYQDSEVDSVPEYIGGKVAMMQHIHQAIIDVDSRGCTGMLMVSFIVEIDGNVSNVKIIRPLCQKADEAVINAVKTMPLWKPGIKNEEYVRVLINMPVRFLLPVKENE
ncbi:MAG: hypothetical protein HOD63_13690 [Bacteroidetes bacterium]|jgi:protein TonB|nr:hypothetical protein [Bacteroidota bacterium]MBT5528770.1 hypothetical protein [Cytophagia bacterium]MBT3422092.1 hypothetical protein [Bacteroidota bacterium]MBT3800139.1 hypothetical protein [Bacteroidota bacterium]MBT3935927.1 hypothetical protein [Bacteroidota bacterium]